MEKELAREVCAENFVLLCVRTQMCVYYPQTLHMEEEELSTLVRLMSSHQSTHGAF